MSATVVQLRPRAQRKPVIVTGSPLFVEAWLAFPDTGRLRSSRKVAWPEWSKVAAEIGEDVLVACVRRYAAEDKEHRRECGAPGFDRWLKWGRWEHWLPVADTPQAGQPRFEPENYRARFVQLLGESFVRSWIDQCLWQDGGLVAPRQFTVDTLRRTFSAKQIALFVTLANGGAR